MKLLVVALYPEARPWIVRLGLKKPSSANGLEVYLGQGHALLVTGVGKVPAAVRVARALELSELSGVRCVINIGICGCADASIALGTVFLANKIEEAGTGRAFFPDMLVRHPFLESALVTVERPVLDGPNPLAGPVLYDMEAAGIFQAASCFVTADRQHYIKVVSDHLDGGMLSKERIEELVEQAADAVLDFVNALPDVSLDRRCVLLQEDEAALDKLCAALRLTRTQSVQVRDWAIAYRLAGKQLLATRLSAVAESQPEGQTKADRATALETLQYELAT